MFEHTAKAWIENGRLQVHIDLKGLGEGEGSWVTTDAGNRLFLTESGDLMTKPPSVGGEVVAGGGGSSGVQDIRSLDDATLESVFGIKRREEPLDPDVYRSGVQSNEFQGMGSVESYAAIRGIAKAAGVSYDSVRSMVMPTIFRPFNSSHAGSGVVEGVSRSLGIEMSAYDKQRGVENAKEAKAVGKRQINKELNTNGFSFHIRAYSDNDMDKYAKATYDETQKHFKQHGIEAVTVYRGMGKERIGGKSNTLESWTVDRTVADDFAKSYKGSVESATIPVSRIFATPATGWGVGSQAEVIVLGDALKTKSVSDNKHFMEVNRWEQWMKDNLPGD